MKYVVIGCIAFGFMYVFDLNKIRHKLPGLNIFFAVTVCILAYATLRILTGDYDQISVILPVRIVAGILAAASLVLLLYSLFGALPFKGTYVDNQENNEVVNTGMYALCRHPGVIWFFFLFLFLFLVSGIKMMLWAGLMWTVLDVVHVYLQDRWFFPLTLKDYHLYQKDTPFLVPNGESIKKCVTTFGRAQIAASNPSDVTVKSK